MSAQALIADPSVPVCAALRRYLESAGFEVRVVHFLDEAVEQLRSGEPALLFAAATEAFDGETLCRRARALLPTLPVVLVYPPEVEDPEPHATAAGADSWLVGPLKRATVIACARAVLRAGELSLQVAGLKRELEARSEAQPASELEFFKRVLLTEVKRSRRYGYPVSFLLVALDVPARAAELAEAFGVVTRGIRDIDLAVPFGGERILAFLPHTPRSGALVVAGRLREKLAQLRSLPEATASIGVACYEPGGGAKEQVSFGSLLKEATLALKKAQAAGGDRVEAGEKRTRSRISMG